MGEASRGRLLVADAAATRGLHLDGVQDVYVLGLPANSDTYLHLAGRAGRWPRTGQVTQYLCVYVYAPRCMQGSSPWALNATLGSVHCACVLVSPLYMTVYEYP